MMKGDAMARWQRDASNPLIRKKLKFGVVKIESFDW